MYEHEVSITVRVTVIRDGTQGISLSAPNKVLGEWQDSGAALLKLTEDNAVSICGEDGSHRYRLSLPGVLVKSDLLSPTEAVLIIRV